MEKIEIFAGATLYSASNFLEEMAEKIVIKQRIFDPSSQQLIIFYEQVPTVKVKSFENKDDDTINHWLASQKKEAAGRSGMFRVVQCLLSVSMEPGMSKTVTQIFYEEL
jgi:hypothetical protein